MEARWGQVKSIWWTTLWLALVGNMLVAFFGETSLLRVYRLIASVVWTIATLVVIVVWVQRRRARTRAA